MKQNEIFKEIVLTYIAFINFFRTLPDYDYTDKQYAKPTKAGTVISTLGATAITTIISSVINLAVFGKEHLSIIAIMALSLLIPYIAVGIFNTLNALAELLDPILNEFLDDDVKAEVGLIPTDKDNKFKSILCIFRGQYIGVIPLKGYEIDIMPYIQHFLHKQTGVTWTLESQSYEPELLEFTNNKKTDLTIFVQFTDQVEKLNLIKVPTIKHD